MDKGLLADATSTDDTPTPGYMLNEISRATIANYQANVQIQDYLVSRVQNKHHNVKFKALLIIKHVCRTGRPEFKREMQRKVDSIKECLQFKGNPDPLRGDEPNRRVREAAKETLDAIFDSQMPVTTSAVATSNRIQGMGNNWTPPETTSKSSGGILSSIVSSVSTAVLGDGTDVSYAGHPGATGNLSGPGSAPSGYSGNPASSYSGTSHYSNSTSSMTGFGNPNFSDARQEKSWVQKASDYLGSGKNTNSPPPVTFAAPVSDYKYATNRGPTAINNSGWQPQGASVVPDLPPVGVLGAGRTGGAASDGAYERGLVNNLCEPSGLKPVPNEKMLSDFLVSAPSLSAEVIGSCLLDNLNSDAWQSRTKALIVIGQLVQSNNCQSHMDFWCAHEEDIKALQQDGKAGVRTQANKVMKLITPEGESDYVPAMATTSASNSTARKNDSLLDMLDDSPSPIPPQNNAVPSTSNDGSEALFAGMSLTSSPIPTNSNFQTSASAPPSTSNMISSLDFLSDSFPSQPTPIQSVTPASAPVPAAPASSTVDIFGDLTLHNNSKVQPATAAPAQSLSTTSVAFDFLSGNDPVPAPVTQPIVSSNTQPSTGFSFMAGGAGSSFAAPGNSISNAYSESPKRDNSTAFLDLSHSLVNPSGPSAYNSPPPAPIALGNQGYAYNAPQYQTAGYGNVPTAYPSPVVRPGSSVLAPGMLNPLVARKDIPDANGNVGQTGFSFMGGAAPQQNQGKNDSFSFVSDAMKTMSK